MVSIKLFNVKVAIFQKQDYALMGLEVIASPVTKRITTALIIQTTNL